MDHYRTITNARIIRIIFQSWNWDSPGLQDHRVNTTGPSPTPGSSGYLITKITRIVERVGNSGSVVEPPGVSSPRHPFVGTGNSGVGRGKSWNIGILEHQGSGTSRAWMVRTSTYRNFGTSKYGASKHQRLGIIYRIFGFSCPIL
ncbi:uncharacterized protein LOC108735695 [Agrilus planipennis]|uniref:Uncharacterized protein LOC108735695 n=1 Tax=Agrilus planipennis TaxID=224129 RepID=A0A1W4WT07_AGRPL|nr:uncharacterized protein LOC108735695 [Agrilus planipennis]